jgi:hypothetical protein
MQILGGLRGASAAETPCPDVFQYEGSSGNEYGVITVPNPYPYLAIDITVSMYITAPVPSVTHMFSAFRDKNRKISAGLKPFSFKL